MPVDDDLPGLAAPEPAAACAACERLRAPIEIRLPSQLRRVLEAVRELVEAGELRVLPRAPGAPDEPPFSSLSHDGPWPDVLDHRFRCRRCGTHFALSAETYHGSGGEWRPLP